MGNNIHILGYFQFDKILTGQILLATCVLGNINIPAATGGGLCANINIDGLTLCAGGIDNHMLIRVVSANDGRAP